MRIIKPGAESRLGVDAKPGRRRTRSAKVSPRVLLLLLTVCSLAVIAPTLFFSKGATSQAQSRTAQASKITPYVGRAVGFAESRPLRELALQTRVTREELLEKGLAAKDIDDKKINEKNEIPVKSQSTKRGGAVDAPDPLIQRQAIDPKIPSPIVNFDGLNGDGNIPIFGGRVLPPDTNMAVGPNHIVQTVNTLFRIWDKSGSPLTAGASLGSLWATLSGACADANDGDPIVLYDWQADRWMISQFCTVANPNNHQIFAISKTNDPTGAYYLYDFMMPNNKFNDYPHFGAWPDAYYMSDNQFNQAGTAFLGAGAFAFDRKKMLTGDPTATFVYFDIATIDANAGGMLPTNLNGFAAPPVGTPNTFWEFRATEFGDPLDALRPYEFHVDFAVPANSTLTVKPDLALAAFDARSPSSRAAIEQPSPGVALDAIADRMMNLMHYRVLSGGVQSYVGNFTVNVSGTNPTSAGTYQTGIRWVELRRSGTTYSVNQQGTHNNPTISGTTGENFWMGSAAQDNEGNIGLGYSRSSSTQMPTISYAGRLAGDTAGTLAQGSADIIVGTGVQTSSSSRWGDYSALVMDPSDDCTFWYTTEYYTAASQALSSAAWLTRIASFKVNASCAAAQKGTITGTVTACSGGAPIANAVVTTPEGYVTTTNASGQYTITAAPGTYSVTISAPSSTTCTNSVVVTNGGNAVNNCCLGGAPVIVTAGATLVSESCTPANSALDPNEVVTVSLCVQNTGLANTTNLVGTLQATGGVTSPSGPQTYGVVTAGGPAVCRNFTFTVGNVLCGTNVVASLQLQDGASSLGTLTYTFGTGVAGSPVTVSYTAPAVAIPDNNATGVNITLPVAAISGGIADIDFRIDGSSCNTTNPSLTVGIDHSWVGDLVLKLTSPGGTTVTIMNRPGGGTFGSSGNNFCQTLLNDDGAFPSIQTITSTGAPPLGPPYTGTFLAANPLSAFDGQDPNGTWTLNVSDNAGGDTGFVRAFSLIITPRVCAASCSAPTCTITCPANVTQSNDPNQCGAVVTYAAPTTTGSCGTVTCSPPSGSFFPKGTTTVTCTTTAGPSCSFTVTVNDTQPPTITCPANVIAVATPSCPAAAASTVTYATPTATDNCPGVTVACTPASGTSFPAGTTTVTCTATDASGNTATCSFSVKVFNIAIQDRSNAAAVLAWNSSTGEYVFCCNGSTFTGTGKVATKGCTYTLDAVPSDRRVHGSVNMTNFTGEGYLQSPPGTTRCSISDNDVRNNTYTCLGGAPMGANPSK